MTVYTELLKGRLAEEPNIVERAVDQLVADLVKRRARLTNERRVPRRRGAPRDVDPARSVSASLAYDAALVRLCERLDIPHHLLDAFPAPDARHAAEQALRARLPGLGALHPPADPVRAIRP